ncbi:hypothetical protein N0V90_007113 [Kalmusia sp. IMI 367209]|nr:hypothetical protein N0V90_007113 [Kalmusia sp. IMI 367209]
MPAHRAKATNDLEMNRSLLEKLGETFWSARVMADMASVTLLGLDRVLSHTQNDEQRKDPNCARPIGNLNKDVQQPLNELQPPLERFCHADKFFTSGLPEMDPFDMLDPQFDLDGMDAFWEGNIDLAAPVAFR